ncbi:MAG TPA: plastocyanin/azurin family copper-binding protein [Nitrososphaeraceae archaeon]
MTAARNRTLQIVGLVVIAISLISVTFAAYRVNTQSSASTTSKASSDIPINSRSNTAANQIAAATTINQSRTTQIKIPSGDGKGPNVNPVYYIPSEVVIHSGDRVQWTNFDTVGHTATSTSFNSGLIWPVASQQEQNNLGPSTFIHKFNKPGTYAYFCQIHPYMSGVVYVDVQETERVLSIRSGSTSYVKVNVEMPQNAAYQNNYGPYFIPTYAKIPLNGVITWTNKDYVAHTATATDGSFDTQPILPGESRTFQLNHTPGTIGYYCKIHPWMQASIDVSSSSAISKKA